MEAIIKVGGKQYKVSEGSVIRTEKLNNLNEGETLEIKDVLAIINNQKIVAGKPNVDGASVVLKKLEDGKGKKIIVFKFKRKKRYRRKYGHRQWYSLLKVEKINWEEKPNA